jgi:hypothetical protein
VATNDFFQEITEIPNGIELTDPTFVAQFLFLLFCLFEWKIIKTTYLTNPIRPSIQRIFFMLKRKERRAILENGRNN